MLKCVMFDMDGTIGDTMPLCLAAFRCSIETLSNRHCTDEEIYATFGPSEEGTIAVFLPEQFDEGCRQYQHHYDRLHAEIAPSPFDGIVDAIQSLKDAGLLVALVTGKGINSLNTTLRHYGMEYMFDAIATGNPSGPDKPRCIRNVLSDLALDAAEAIYVGDTASDVVSAREAGMGTVAVAWASTANIPALQAEQPLAVCSSVEEFSAYMADMLSRQ